MCVFSVKNEWWRATRKYFHKPFFSFTFCWFSSGEMQINVGLANGERRRYNTARSLQRTHQERNTVVPGPYNPVNTLKDNYLFNLGVQNRGVQLSRQVRTQGPTDGNRAWGTSSEMFKNALSVASHFEVPSVPPNVDRSRLFSKAFAEYIMEMERVIQRRVLSRDQVALPVNERHQQAYLQQVGRSIERLYSNGLGDIQSLQELTTRFRRFDDAFWADQRYKGKWSSDFRSLMDDTIKSLLGTFQANPGASFLGELIPNLRTYIPAQFASSPHRRRPRGYVYRMDGNRDFLRIIFNIMMIRLPVTNTLKQELWSEFSIPMMLHRYREEGDGDRVPEDSYMSTVTVMHTNTSLRNLFYYIPQQERVVGCWPKTVRVNRGDDNLSTLHVNYNMQMVRSVLCKLVLREEDRGSRLQFAELFQDPNNFYHHLRRMDPFQLGEQLNPYVRLYVSMTVFSQSNDKLFHVPWTLESTVNPMVPGSTRASLVAFDYSELIRVIILILERKISGNNTDEDPGEVIYIIIKWISDRTPTEYQDHWNRLQLEEEEDEKEDDGGGWEEKKGRTCQLASRTAPKKPEVDTLAGMMVGAPYTGTDKERNFYSLSMMNRFQMSDALFETPQRSSTYSCFLMSVIRCQMYMYTFENRICKEVLVTNGTRADMTCEGKYVQATMDYSGASCTFPFLKKIEGEYYIRLFNNVKHTLNGKYLPGCRNEEEIQYWEMAADEIWIHLERYCGRELNYNDLGDYGQVFADFFQVCISIYDVEYRGNRIAVITPHRKSPLELAEEGEILMIHIVFDQGHIHAVNNLRNFIRSKRRSTDVRQTHYCPICDAKQTDQLTSSKESALNHITKCCHNHEKMKTGFEREEKIRVQAQYCQVNTVFRKEKGKSRMIYQCSQCHQEVNQMGYMCHVCTIQKKKLSELHDEKIYVWDVEAAQLEDDFHLLKHECNCVYVRRVYFDEVSNPELKLGKYFPSEVEFVEALLNESEYQGATFLAHNGGSYDIHFLLRVFERLEIEHTFAPSPTSKHKFIKVHMLERDIQFLDFMRFIPGSLRSIAESFQVNVSKGDFPYRFNNGENDSYVGCIPPLDHEADYWGLSEARSEKQVTQFRTWYASQCEEYCTCPFRGECVCTKKKWDFQEEMKRYCLMDVVVLAEVVKAYRNKVMSFEAVESEEFPDSSVAWKIPKMDPFQFMTLPQITMQTLVHGMTPHSYDGYGFTGVTSFFQPHRPSRCPEALLWLRRCADLEDGVILSRENCNREFYEFQLQMGFDGYAPVTNTVYIFLKCSWWGCPHCMREYHESPNQSAILPDRGLPCKDVQEHYEVVMHHLHSNYNVRTIWQHEFNVCFFDPYLLKCVNQMSPSECFYGGRTEVFKLYCNASKFPEDEIHYFDVTSLYPSVYAHRMLPMGNPRYYIGYDVDPARLHPDHPDRYFGYVRVRVRPPNTDRIGLLPQRDPQTQRLTFPVHPMEGCWFTEEIYLAMGQGYVVEQIYELYHWSSNQLSDQHLRGYVGYFLRMKQEAEGWKKLGASCEHPTPEEQQEIALRLYHQNGNLAFIRPEKVKLDPVMRALAKLFLNSLWGKWAQKPSKECQTTVYGMQQFFQLWNDRSVEKESCLFRDISPGVYKVNYRKKEAFVQAVPHGNIWLAAAVTAWARIALHTQMLRIGAERLIYCDTDSIIFRWPKNGQNLTGVGLGHWTDEYPGHTIDRVYALAPKLYALSLTDKRNPTVHKESYRAKGVQMTLANQIQMSFSNILPLIQKTVTDKETQHSIPVKNFSIFTNSTNNELPFGFLYTRYNTKNVRVIITKRTVEEVERCDFDELAEINTYPPGYDLQ